MPDGVVARQRREVAFIEDLRDQPDVFVHADRSPIGHGDARRFLSAMLQRIQAKERHARDIFVRRVDADDAAFFVGSVLSCMALPVAAVALRITSNE